MWLQLHRIDAKEPELMYFGTGGITRAVPLTWGDRQEFQGTGLYSGHQRRCIVRERFAAIAAVVAPLRLPLED